jgi:hypothetical protein
LTSIENVISDKGYHIHSHSLCAGNVNEKITNLQDKFKAKWLKITGDSDIISLDLIKSENLQGAILEVVKYATKITNLNDLKGTKLDNYVNWIIQSKGQNFVNCSGIFRGLELTGNKSKYDSKKPTAELDNSYIYHIGRSAKMDFNFATLKNYSEVGKQHMKKNLKLLKVDPDGFVVNSHFRFGMWLDLEGNLTPENLKLLKDSILESYEDDEDFGDQANFEGMQYKDSTGDEVCPF